MFGTVLKLLLLKNLKTTLRQKKLLITEIILLFIIVPGFIALNIWNVTKTSTSSESSTPAPVTQTTVKNKDINNLLIANGFTESTTIPFQNPDEEAQELQKQIEAVFKMFEDTIEWAGDVTEYDITLFLVKAYRCREHLQNIFVNISKLSSESFEYKLVLRDLYGNTWHNEPHMVPDLFGYPAKNYTFNENTNAFNAQFCLNKAFVASQGYENWKEIKILIETEELQEDKTKSMKYTETVKLIYTLFPILINIPILITAHKLCEEKENNIHTFMVVMGLDRSLFILSHLIFAFIKMYIYVLPIGITVAICFERIGGLMFVLLLLYSHAAVSSIFLVSSLTKNSTVVVLSSIGFNGIFHLFSPLFKITVFDITEASILSFFIPQIALSMGCEHLTKAELYDQPINFFAAPFYLPLCVPVFALLFQSLFFLLLAFYFDAVIPVDDSPKKHPLFFLGVKYDNISESLKETELKSLAQESSQQPKNDAYFENDKNEEMQADIDVFHLTKKWSNDRFGVQDITFKAYNNQVTALLGHNGAGKSTTFSILSGLTKSTYGKAYVCGQEPRTLSDNPNVGFCPQWDPLFPHLTIREHLSFYQILKGVNDPEEIEGMIQKLGLNDFVHYRAKYLSSGVKRKLCVGMAMIGNSKVIILDEPTHGMDTLSRKQLIEIIRAAKTEHTILLATHYMDEADAVSDRIIILSNGKIVCNGSSNFLKSKFVTGFLLTVDFTTAIGPESYQEFAEAILSIVCRNCKEAKIDGHVHQQFTIILPHGSQKLFPLIFNDLETQKDAFQINSFDIGTNTLEQVFIKVTDEAEPNKAKEANESVKEFIEKRSESQTCSKIFISQVIGLLIRKFHYTRRHYILSAVPYLCVLVFVGFYFFSIYGPKITVWQKEESTRMEDYPEMTIFCYPKCKGEKKFPKNVHVIRQNLTKILKDKSLIFFENAPLAFGIEEDKNTFKIFYRNGFPNGVPVALTTIFSYYYFYGKEVIKTNISIESENYDLANENSYTAILCFSMMYPLSFIIPVFLHVEEIGHGIVHLYQRTQMSLFSYWFASFIFDFIYALIPIAIEVVLIVIFDDGILYNPTLKSFFIIGLLLLILIFLLQSYAVSLFFKSSVFAVISLLLFNVMLALVSYFVIVVMNYDLIYSSIFFPLLLVQSILTAPVTEYTEELYGICITPDVEHACLGTFYLIVAGNILFYLTVLLIWNFRRYIFSCQNSPSDLTPYKENEDVLEEKRRVESLGPNAFEIYTLNLRKTYSGLVAVRDITMGIAKAECFGLLGANGAGKSTFFNMLTALMKPSCGIGFVGGVDIRKQPLFGFCPQTSRFVPELSVEETLYFFARLKGIILKKEFIEVVVDAFYLSNIKDTRVGKLTGGECRRLSIAVALITSSEIIMLDEPTTGVDPRTRRHIWELLIALRTNGSSQLLTSHSMEECEALCTKVGFINHGVFIGIGTSQHLKYRFGNTHRLTIILNAPKEILAEKLNSEFQIIFNATPISVTGNVPDLIWSIPKTSEPLSSLYSRLIQFVDAQPKEVNGENPIKDFSIVGTNLEEVFATMVDTKIQYEFRF